MNANNDHRDLQPESAIPRLLFYPDAYSRCAHYDDDGGIDISWLWLFFKRRFTLISTTVVVGTAMVARPPVRPRRGVTS